MESVQVTFQFRILTFQLPNNFIFRSLRQIYNMRTYLRNPFIVFFLAVLVVSTLLFTIPINLFDGEVTYSVNGITFTEPMKLSLSYFLGIGLTEGDLQDVQGFRLIGTGYLLVGLITLGFPALIGYRVWIANEVEVKKKKS